MYLNHSVASYGNLCPNAVQEVLQQGVTELCLQWYAHCTCLLEVSAIVA